MATLTLESKTKPLWRRTVFVICVVSGLFTAIYKAMDNLTVHNVIIAPDSPTAAMAYLVVGGWMGVILGVIFAVFFGQRFVDPEFQGFVFRNRPMHLQAAVAGGVGAISTLSVLMGNQQTDPSVLMAFASLQLVLTGAYDVCQKQLAWQRVVLPAVLITIGSAAVSFGGSLAATLMVVVYVVFVSNGFNAIGEILGQRGTRASDGVNFYIWRFFWLALVGTFVAVTLTLGRGTFGLFTQTVQWTVMSLWPIGVVSVTMFFVFLAEGLRNVAKKTDAVTYVVLLVASIQLLLCIPITLIGNWIRPGVFGDIPAEAGIWVVRSFGVLAVAWSVKKLHEIKAK